MDFFRRQNWDIVGRSRLWFTISIVVIAIGMGTWAVRGLNWGIDFTGGTLLRYQFERPLVTQPGQAIEVTQQTRAMLAQMGLTGSQIQVAGDNEIYIRVAQVETDAEARMQDEAIETGLTEMFGERGGELISLGRETVGPVIGEMLRRSAIQALTLGIILILIYITVRYEFRFAIAAVVALVHDTAILVGAMAILQTELNTWFVAAMLTVLGYSINDTVVIFDRIRENRTIHRRAKINEVVNASLLQTMARSINTALTTLFTLTALYLLGGVTIQGFALALIVGVATGAYSSIFTASPFVCTWYNAVEAKKTGERTRSRRPAAVRPDQMPEIGTVEAAEEQPEGARPTARDTMKEAERAAQEEKRRMRRERRKKRDDKPGRGRDSKRRF